MIKGIVRIKGGLIRHKHYLHRQRHEHILNGSGLKSLNLNKHHSHKINNISRLNNDLDNLKIHSSKQSHMKKKSKFINF